MVALRSKNQCISLHLLLAAAVFLFRYDLLPHPFNGAADAEKISIDIPYCKFPDPPRLIFDGCCEFDLRFAHEFAIDAVNVINEHDQFKAADSLRHFWILIE